MSTRRHIIEQSYSARKQTLRDKRYARRLLEIGEVIMPEGIRRIEDFPNLAEAMQNRGWPEPRIRKVIGGNWQRLFREVWGA